MTLIEYLCRFIKVLVECHIFPTLLEWIVYLFFAINKKNQSCIYVVWNHDCISLIYIRKR